MFSSLRKIVYLLVGLSLIGCSGSDSKKEDTKREAVFSAPAVSVDGGIISFDIASEPSSEISSKISSKVSSKVSSLAVEDFCDDESLKVLISVADSNSSDFTLIDTIHKKCNSLKNQQVSMVLDNSASAKTYLDKLKTASKDLVSRLEVESALGSVTRISTNASVQHPMSDDYESLKAAIDELWSKNGYSAMYDAMRMGFQTMDLLASTYTDEGRLDNFCDNRQRKAMVLFSDGGENNSADEFAKTAEFSEGYDIIKYPGDKIDSSLDMIIEMGKKYQVPIYTIGLGDNHDVESMKKISSETGGFYISGENAEDIPKMFEKLTEYLKGATSLCFDVKKITCGNKQIKVQYQWAEATERDGVFNSAQSFEEKIFNVEIPCDRGTPLTTPPAVVNNRCKQTDNILKNPSFEFNEISTRADKWYTGQANERVIRDITNAGHWDVYRYLPYTERGHVAWYTSAGSGIELHHTGTVAQSADGTKHVELDSHSTNSNSSMTQNVFMCPGTYELSAKYYARTSNIEDNNIEVYVDNVLMGTLQDERDGIWHDLKIPIIVGKTSMFRLTFKAGGIENSLGGLLDNVSLIRK